MAKTDVQKAIERKIKEDGLSMTKEISSGGLFSYATYDNRTVYSLADLRKLNKEGFHVDEDMGIFLYNAFMEA